MRSVAIGKIRHFCSDVGSSMTSGLSSLWEDGTYPHVIFLALSALSEEEPSTVDLSIGKLQGKCWSPGGTRLADLMVTSSFQVIKG